LSEKESNNDKESNTSAVMGFLTRFLTVGKGKGLPGRKIVLTGVPVLLLVISVLTWALDYFPKAWDAASWVWKKSTTEYLPGSFPGETWKKAKLADFDWLQDEWCYPSMPDFRIRFRVTNGMLEQQNLIGGPGAHITDWVQPKVYISNQGVLRLRYENDWPGDYINFAPRKTAEWREYVRYGNSDGSVTAGRERLVLSCRRC
jgi:hypothetical protein